VPCFQKVDQNGGTRYPFSNSGWALEISLDVETAHAICQNCRILLVEARTASYADLMSAIDRARLIGAKYISNSYGSNEFSGETTYDSHFKYPGITFTFSAGDSGYGAGYPAASQYVTAVGGTTLAIGANNTYGGEIVWSGTGSGCSKYESKPSWQTDAGCLKRTIADVSADADPSTGAAVYDTVPYFGYRGWFVVGGTSLSAPLIAATYALAGNVPSLQYANSLPYGNAAALNDVTVGSNGSCGSYLCNAGTSYDGPTGLGSPQGITAF
jgi:subtilase family serine protease